MKRLSSLGTLRNKADRLTQIEGKRRYSKCLICGKPNQVLHHFVPKSVSSNLRYDWENLIPLCNGCHMRLHQSGDPDYEQRIIKARGGSEWYEKLRKRGREIIKVNREYFTKVIEKLTGDNEVA